jgi:hypothetical protein
MSTDVGNVGVFSVGVWFGFAVLEWKNILIEVHMT